MIVVDHATEYAENVVDNKIVANKHVINACRRHLDDLEHRDGKDLIWAPERAEPVREFFKDCCTVSDPETGGNTPLILLPWQEFAIQSFYGWIIKHDRKTKRQPFTRKYRKLFVTSAKSSGKSALFNANNLYLISYDHWVDGDGNKHFIEKPTVLVSASKKEQAIAVSLRISAEMVENSEMLSSGMQVLGGNTPDAIVCPTSFGRLEAITHRSGTTGLGGRLIHGLHMEETSEDSNRERWDALMAGLKMSPQPVITIATNPPPMMSGIAHDEYRQAISASSGDPSFDHVLGLVYAMDDDEIPESVVNVQRWWPTEKTWEKANPSIRYGMPPKHYMHSQIKGATTTQKKRNVLRLNFGAWQDQKNEFIERDQVVACQVEEISEDELKGMPLWVGLDLATTGDLTAIAMLWGDVKDCYLKVEAYTGLADIAERSKESSGDMESWVEEGYIQGNDARTLDFKLVTDRIQQLHDDHDLQAVVMDTWRKGDWIRTMEEMDMRYRFETDEGWGAMDGILFVPHAQGYRNAKSDLFMETSLQAIEEAVYNQHVKIERNPVFQWAIECARVKHNEKMERKITKFDASNATRGKIDVLIASIMAFGLMRRGLREPDFGKKGPNPWANPKFDLAKLQSQLYG